MQFSLANGMALCGVLLILEGTVFTLIGQVSEKTESIVDRHLLFPGCNGNAIRSVVKQKRQTGFGLILIVSGGVTQIISSMATIIIYSSAAVPFWVIGIVFILPGVFFFFILNRLIKKQGDEAVEMALAKLRGNQN